MDSCVGNRCWVLRHGKSIPNERGLIVSSMENGVLPDFQLAPDGVAQALLSGELFLKQLKESNIELDKVRICYSPFSRTTHTARVVAELPQYPEIWALDENDPFMRPQGGESADDVVSRLTTAMESIEAEYQGHGDPLQMLQNVFHSAMLHKTGDGFAERIHKTRGASVLSQHRKFALLTGELRPLI